MDNPLHPFELHNFVEFSLFGLDISLNKAVLMMWVVVALVAALMIKAGATRGMVPTKLQSLAEMLVDFIRSIILDTMGKEGMRFFPLIATLFLFILFCNLLGLIPYGSTATGNVSVTATMAILSLMVTEISGMRALGKGYFSTVFYWNRDMALPMRIVMFLVMSPVEIISKFTKPFALAIRLFANMTAGHIVVLAFIGLIFAFKLPVGLAPLVMAIAIMLLEIFVAFLQAFIFTLLTSVFIGQMRMAHH